MKTKRRRKWKVQKKYRLWTFQSVRAIQELKSTGILEANWDRYLQTGTWIRAYRWMAALLAARKIACYNRAPIWAWHSCGKYEHAPSLLDARCLLSDAEIAGGIQVIEFECPVELTVLSSYGMWNNILYDFFFTNTESKINIKTMRKLFATSRKNFKKYDSIQATLPYLKFAWVKDIRELNLKPNDFSYSGKEEV